MPDHRSTPVLVNRTLAHYRVLAQLGKGGMGEVYLAEDLRLRRRVALKVLPPDLAEEPRHLERFRREARSVAALNHPNIVTLYSVEEAEGLHFLVLEVVEGETLADLLADGPLPLERLLPIARSLAEALEAAHSCGVIHRDLKPRNVMVSREGRVKILDFGIARWAHSPDEEREDSGTSETDLTKTGRLIGTAAYMSPEQIQGEPVDPRSDLFSLGVLLYEMATGQQPFQGKGRLSTMAAVLHDTPPPPSTLMKGLPDRFDRIVSRCLAKETSRRYQDAIELRLDLDACSEQDEVPLSSEAETETALPRLSSDTTGRSLTSPRIPALPRCFGREQEVRDLAAALCSDPPQPVPVLGPAGAGKSTITLAALHDREVVERFGRRRFFIRCDAATSRDSLIGAIARSVRPEAEPPLEPQIVLEREEAPSVLVLDNFETPWELDTAAVEELITELAAVPGLALVAALRGEQRPFGPNWREAIHAGPLDPFSARNAFLAIAGERYQNDTDLNGLLLELDGLALAVILLASQAEGEPDLSILRQRWQDQRTSLLRRAGAQERLQSLEVSLRLSIDSPRVTEESRRLLSILGLLPEGVAREDLMELLPQHGHDAASVLRKVGLAFDQGSRFRMLAPVREYVRQYHPPLPEDLDRTVDHYLTLARLGEKIGAQGGAEATKRLRSEAGNLESMILVGLERSDPAPAIVSALAYSEVIRFTGQGSIAVIGSARHTAQIIGETLLEASCAFQLGDIEFSRSRAENAQAAFEQALILYRGAADQKGEACCLIRLGEVELILRTDYKVANRLFEQALPIFRDLGDFSWEGQCLVGLGSAAINRSDFTTARALLQEARSLLQSAGDKRSEANCLLRMGHGSLEIGDLDTAQMEFEEALTLFRQLGILLGEANCIRNLGHIALNRNDPVTAHSHFERALVLSRRVASRLGEANCLYFLGEAARDLGKLDRSDILLQRGRLLYQRIGQVVGEAHCTEGLGENAAARNHSSQANYWFDQALSLFRRIPQPTAIGRVHLHLAKLSPPGSPERIAHLEEARQTWQKAGLLDQFHDELEAVEQAPHSST